MKHWLIQFIRAYQIFFGPFLGGHCRFHPTCSEYAKESILKCTFLNGIFRSFQRLMKCHPWHEGGIDLP